MAETKPTAKKPSGPDLLRELQAGLKDIRTILEKEFENTFVQQHVRQSIQSAETGIEQEIRNIGIEAEMQAKKDAGLIK